MNRFEYAVKKLFEAYLKDELDPCDPCRCFCGTWLGGDEWYVVLHKPFIDTGQIVAGEYQIKKSGYTLEQVAKVEAVFMRESSALLVNFSTRDFKDLYPAVKAVFNLLASWEEDETQAIQFIEELEATK